MFDKLSFVDSIALVDFVDFINLREKCEKRESKPKSYSLHH